MLEKVGGNILLWGIFAGSIFYTSDLFYYPATAPQYYFTILTVCLMVLLIALTKGSFDTFRKLFKLCLLQGFYVIGFIQAVYGICQYLHIIEVSYALFPVVGSFDNPAGFSVILSALFPIGIYWCINSGSNERRCIFISVLIYCYAIIISESRAGIVAIILATIVILFTEHSGFIKLLRKKTVLPILFLSFICGLFFLYQYKPDSANGRILIWRVCFNMIKDKPIFGFGHGSFNLNYMDYQAHYLEVNPDLYHYNLADNIDNPFNEFIKISVEYGISGILILLGIIFLCCHVILKYGDKYKNLFFASLIAIMSFTLFSYPSKYPSVWLLLLFYFCFILFNIARFRINNRMSIIIRLILIMGGGVLLYIISQNRLMQK